MKSGIRKIGDTSHNLAKSILLEETGSPTIVRLTIVFIAFIFGIFIFWAINAEIDEVAIAVGETLPLGQVQKVQSIAGGVVTEILVENGQFVEKGQPLFNLDPILTQSELSQTLDRENVLLIQKERLTALIDKREPDFSSFAPMPHILQVENNILTSTKINYNTTHELFQNRISQQQAALTELNEQKKALLEQEKILKEELSMREKLFEKQLNSKIILLSLKRQISQLQGELASLPPKREQILKKIEELKNQAAEFDQKNHETYLQELNVVEKALTEIREEITRKRETAGYMEIHAPKSGIVHALQINTIGAVVAAGGLLLEIVPKDQVLRAEIQISTKDVGHVHPGIPVTLKFNTYNYSIYGTLEGELLEVSATTVLDRIGNPYYKGIVNLPHNYLGNDPKLFPILPGMTLQADIKTGRKTVMQYLLKPVFRSASEAFREK
ncbi:MAG: HlyD family type I secretion periplasmic adaptor subunit [Desulfamplus sp.]|nr:HlyD family type I secretion periplasmic adaptor subunit [Desulfamplus sp.]